MGRALYNFIWDDFCDWYIEMAKLPLYGEDEDAKKMTRSVLAYVLDNTMRLLHPFMPFITEENLAEPAAPGRVDYNRRLADSG